MWSMYLREPPILCRQRGPGPEAGGEQPQEITSEPGHHPPKMTTLRNVSHAVAPSPPSIALTSKSAFRQ